MTEPRPIKSPARERVRLSSVAEEAFYRYARGILEGELKPLADYLAAGHPMDHVLRKALIELIDGGGAQYVHCEDQPQTQTGDGLWKLKLCKNRRGAGTALSRRRTVRKQVEIATYYLQRPHGRGEKLDAVMDTAEHFGIERTTVTGAIKAAGERAGSGEKPK